MGHTPRPFNKTVLRPLVQEHFHWTAWARCIQRKGVCVDRPAQSRHPDYPSIVYPLDYGYIPGTVGADDEPVDVFCGTGSLGLVGALLTTDFRQEDQEITFLLDCTPTEVYTAHGFVNYDRRLLEGVLALRVPMSTLWERSSS